MTNQAVQQSERFTDVRVIADLMQCSPSLTPAARAALAQMQLYAAGYGSIARPACDRLCDFELLRYVLADPKRYRKRSVASQCDLVDVRRFKVNVGRQRLAERGARVRAFHADLFTLPDGLVSENTIVMVTADNRRADIGANRLAARMRARMLKVNIEPRYHLISVRCYDFRRQPEICCECQFSDRGHYDNQRHPMSCDDPAGRRTAAPRWLSRAAGNVGALVVAQLADEQTAERWYNRQWQVMLHDPQPLWSELTASTTCRFDHGEHWPNLERLASRPGQLSLHRLLRMADADDDAELRFCQQVTTRVCCDRCGSMQDRVCWLSGIERPVGSCECGGRLLAVGYFTYKHLRAGRLRSVLHQPLAAWDVAPHAVIEITGNEHRRSFVIGDGAAPGARN